MVNIQEALPIGESFFKSFSLIYEYAIRWGRNSPIQHQFNKKLNNHVNELAINLLHNVNAIACIVSTSWILGYCVTI